MVYQQTIAVSTEGHGDMHDLTEKVSQEDESLPVSYGFRNGGRLRTGYGGRSCESAPWEYREVR
jgi:hypothetical protein